MVRLFTRPEALPGWPHARVPLPFEHDPRLPPTRSEAAAVVQRFAETRDDARWGLVAQALTGALRALIQDWHVMVAQLEHQMHTGKLTLQVGGV